MSFQDFMARVRYLDNRCAHWMMRHIYILFFEFVLVIIFFMFFFHALGTIDIYTKVTQDNLLEQLLLQQSTLTIFIIVLLFLNSFWMLYIFNGMNRIRVILKDISYYLSRRKCND